MDGLIELLAEAVLDDLLIRRGWKESRPAANLTATRR